MKKSQVPSPARSQGAPVTPKRLSSRKTRSVGSPARSRNSDRLSTLVDQFKANNKESLAYLSPLDKTFLSDKTDIDMPRRKSWWKKVDNSRDVIEVLDKEKQMDPAKSSLDVLDDFQLEFMSVEKSNFTKELLVSSDSDTIKSIEIPQRRLFTQKENVPQNKFTKLIANRESLTKQNKTHAEDKIPDVGPKTLFGQASKRPKHVLRSAQLISPDKTLGNKTNELAGSSNTQARKLFGNRPEARTIKNRYAAFIGSENEDEISDIEHKRFAFHKSEQIRPVSRSSSRGFREPSPSSSITTEMELDNWKLLPSSTLVEHHIAENLTPSRRTRLSKLLEAKESDSTTRQSNQSKSGSANKSSSKQLDKSKNRSISSPNPPNKSKNRSISSPNSLNKSKNKSISSPNPLNKSKNKSISSPNPLNQSKNRSISSPKPPNKSKNTSGSSHKQLNKSKNDSDGRKANKTLNISPKNATFDKNHDGNNTKLKNKSNIKGNVSNQDINEQNKNKEADLQSHDEEREQAEANNKEANLEDNEAEIIFEYGKKENQVNNLTAQGLTQNNEEQKTDVEQNVCQKVDEEYNKQNESQTEKEHNNREEMDVEEDVDEQNNSQDIGKKNDTQQVNEEVLNESQEVDEEEKNESEEVEEEDEKENQEEDEEEKDESEEVDEEVLNESQEVDEEEKNESQDDEQVNIENQEVDEEEKNESEELDEEILNESQEINKEEQNESEEVDEEEKNESQEVDEEEKNDSQEVDEEVLNESQEVDEEEKNDNQKVDEEEEENDMEEEKSEDVDNETQDSDNADGNLHYSEDDDEDENEDNEKQEEKNNQNQSQDIHEYDQNESQEIQNTNDTDLNNSELTDQDENEETEEQEKDERAQSQDIEEDDQNKSQSMQDDVIANSQTEVNITHDTTGRNRKKRETKSPEAVRNTKTMSMNNKSFTYKGRNTSTRKAESIVNNLNIRHSVAPSRESTGLGLEDGTIDSSAEGSGWDSHRTTRKTIRQTFGKDLTLRKSLRTLVMEKSAKRQTEIHEAYAKLHQANSTELPDDNMEVNYEDSCDAEPIESDHEFSRRTRQTTLENYLQKIKNENMERKRKIEEQVRISLKSNPVGGDTLNFKIPTRPAIKRAKINSKAAPNVKRKKPSFFNDENLPRELLEDMKYKPPKKFRPSNAPWITNRLYKFLESKLEPKYDYKARVRAEKLVEMIHNFVRETRRRQAATANAILDLKREMARLEIVNTHFDFDNFFRDYLPMEIRIKVIPSIINDVPMPQDIHASILA